jgi:hypothetical protein
LNLKTPFFSLLDEYFNINSIEWEKLHSLTTDGAANMTGHLIGLIAKIRQKNANVKHIHCALHRFQLATKYLPEDFKSVFDDCIKIINFIRARAKNHRLFKKVCEDLEADFPDLILHTEVRWLSRGKSLLRLYMVKDSVNAFGKIYNFSKKERENEKDKLFERFEEQNFQIILSYLCDIFEKFNKLNVDMQGILFIHFSYFILIFFLFRRQKRTFVRNV